MKSVKRIVATALLCLSISKADAIIVFENPGRRLDAPSDPALEACWKAHGSWQGATGVAVAPEWFITVAHVGVKVGGFFDVQNHTYTTLEVVEIPHTDLLLYRVNGVLPYIVELWDDKCGPELNRQAIVMGRGTARGKAIEIPGKQSPGWYWGTPDGELSWGTNEISQLFNAGPELGSLLVWSWDAKIGGTEATLSSGDSGGGLFLQDANGKWKLAGIHFDVDPSVSGADTQYALKENEPESFWAAVHDGRGMWKGLIGEQFRQLPEESPLPSPMWAGASRIQPHAELIRKITAPGSNLGANYRPGIKWTPRKIWFGIGTSGFAMLCLGLFVRQKRRRRADIPHCNR